MENGIIEVTCKHCTGITKIRVNAVLSLEAENERLTRENDNLRAKVAALEFMKSNQKSGWPAAGFGDLFDSLGGKYPK